MTAIDTLTEDVRRVLERADLLWVGGAGFTATETDSGYVLICLVGESWLDTRLVKNVCEQLEAILRGEGFTFQRVKGSSICYHVWG